MWDFVCIHIKLPLKPSTTPHKPFSSNLQWNPTHILYRRNHQNEFSPNSCYTIRIYSPNPCRAPLGNSPPNPCSTVRNIHLIFVLSLGKDFQHKSLASLIAKFPWGFSFHNWSVRYFLIGLCHIQWSSSSNLKGILVFMQFFVISALILIVGLFQAYIQLTRQRLVR